MLRLVLVNQGCYASSYADVLQRVSNASVVAVVDSNPDAGRDAAGLLGAKRVATSLNQLPQTGGPEFDAVVVHGSVITSEAVDLARSGKHFLVDLAIAEERLVEQLNQACKLSEACLMFGQRHRFQQSLQVMKDRLSSGKLGAPGLLRVHRWESAGDDRSLIQQVICDVDLANWLFESVPDLIYAVAGGAGPGYVQVHLGFPGGGMALIDCATSLPDGSNPYSAVTLVGSTGAAYADQHRNTQLLIGSEQTTALSTGEGDRDLRDQLQEFVDAVEQKREPGVTGAEADAALRVAQTAVQSLATGQAARLVGETYELV